MSADQWTPYRWEPVHYVGSDFRMTFRLRGHVDGMEAILGDKVFPFELGDESAQLLLTEEQAAAIPDRAPVLVRIRSGDGWTTLAQGHLTRRMR